ncbi:MAG: hypothetical protein QOE89_3183 [Pseudonocardiales bacterium]|nr:hypothetical protein [Pseudonocardiales bacterium]
MHVRERALTSVFCTVCGTENSVDSRFCAQCGAPLGGGGQAPGASVKGPESTSIFAHPSTGSTPAIDSDSEFSAEAHQRAVDALTPGSALLVVKRGPNAGSRFLLDQDVTTAGRHPDSDIFLDDVTVSRRHVEFRRDSAGFAVYDVGSLNGTYVNRERIDSAALAGGDEVQIGKFRLVYLTAGGTRA